MDHVHVSPQERDGDAGPGIARRKAARKRLAERRLAAETTVRRKEASESGLNWSVLFRNFALNQRSLQVQIRQMIVAAIEERRLAGNARMPSSRELALALGVARNTVVLAYRQLVENLPELRPRRLIITHMGDDMLARRGGIAHETAEDGLIVEI